MNTWEFETPDGSVYEADGETAEEAYAEFQKQMAADAKAEFEQAPWYEKLGTAAYDTARITNDAMSFGLWDKALGQAPWSEGPEAEKFATERSKDRAGSAGTAAEFLGYGATGRAIPSGVGAAMDLARGPIKKMILGGGTAAAEGAGIAGVDAVARGEDPGEAMERGAVFGPLALGATSVVGKGVNAANTMFGKKAPKSPGGAIDDAIEASGRKGKFDEGMTRRVEGILNNPKKKAKYSPSQIEAMESLATGSIPVRVGRQARKLLSPQFLMPGGALGTALGFATDPLMGAAMGTGIPLAVGLGGKAMSDIGTRLAANRINAPNTDIPIDPQQDIYKILRMLGIEQGKQ